MKTKVLYSKQRFTKTKKNTASGSCQAVVGQVEGIGFLLGAYRSCMLFLSCVLLTGAICKCLLGSLICRACRL